MTQAQQDQIVIGRILGAHGIKGWVKVFSFTDPMEGILDYSPWLVTKAGRVQSLAVEAGNRQGKGLVALLEGFQDRNQAESLNGAEISIPRERLPALEEGEFYWHQLEGLKVVNESGEVLGIVDHMLETGSSDVMVVHPAQDSIDDKERLIPFVEGNTVINVDLDAECIRVAWEADY